MVKTNYEIGSPNQLGVSSDNPHQMQPGGLHTIIAAVTYKSTSIVHYKMRLTTFNNLYTDHLHANLHSLHLTLVCTFFFYP